MTHKPAAGTSPARAAPTPAVQWATQVVYEDEHVLMEWSVRTPATTTIAVTFDPILVDPGQPAYAASFLHKTGIDTLCVRKKSEHFYQPLTRERFEQAAAPVLARYRRRLAYGSSLGAYAALYFCAHGFETVISSSPRVSAHPRFGRPHWQARATFTHEFFDPQRPATSAAVVFYDPNDAMDRRFVDEGLRASWPRARFVAVPYAGHPANQFLSEIGYISPFVQAVVAGKPLPPLNRRGAKARSFTYRHVLAAACMRHGKPRWAERLCRQALAMKPDMVGVKLTLGQALLALGRLDEAEASILEFQQKYPQDGDARQALRTLEKERRRRERQHQLPGAAQRLHSVRSSAGRRLAGWHGRLGLAALRLTSRLRLTVSREDIEWCYRCLLGRPPESERAIVAHRHCHSFEQLVLAFLRSPEFAARAAGGPVEAQTERLVRTVAIVRRVLPAGGRMFELGTVGVFSPAACERIAAGADAAGPVLDANAAANRTGAFDLGLNTEALVLPGPDGARVVQTIDRLLKRGGHVLLTTRTAPAATQHDDESARSDPAGLLQAHGFELIESCTFGSDAGTVLGLARKP